MDLQPFTPTVPGYYAWRSSPEAVVTPVRVVSFEELPDAPKYEPSPSNLYVTFHLNDDQPIPLEDVSGDFLLQLKEPQHWPAKPPQVAGKYWWKQNADDDAVILELVRETNPETGEVLPDGQLLVLQFWDEPAPRRVTEFGGRFSRVREFGLHDPIVHGKLYSYPKYDFGRFAPSEPFEIWDFTEVQQFLGVLGVSDWPSHELERGTLFRVAEGHETHWVVFVLVVSDTGESLSAYGFPKTGLSREDAWRAAHARIAERGLL